MTNLPSDKPCLFHTVCLRKNDKCKYKKTLDRPEKLANFALTRMD